MKKIKTTQQNHLKIMCFGQAIVIFLQNTCSEAFRKKTSVIEVTSTEFLRIKELCLRQVSIRSVCREKDLF